VVPPRFTPDANARITYTTAARPPAGGGGRTRSQRDPTWPPFLLAPLVPTIQKAIATPSSEDDQILHERTEGKKKTTKVNILELILFIVKLLRLTMIFVIV
jgi:hypothetical protein